MNRKVYLKILSFKICLIIAIAQSTNNAIVTTNYTSVTNAVTTSTSSSITSTSVSTSVTTSSTTTATANAKTITNSKLIKIASNIINKLTDVVVPIVEYGKPAYFKCPIENATNVTFTFLNQSLTGNEYTIAGNTLNVSRMGIKF